MSDEYILLKEATVLLKQHKLASAAKIYQKIGESFGKKNFFHKAIAAYQKSLSLMPDPNAQVSMASMFEKIHRLFSAYEALQQALASFTEQKAYKQALETGFTMANLQPTSSYPHQKMAEIYFAMGHPVEASAEFREASHKSLKHESFKKSLELLYHAFKLTPQDKIIWKILRERLSDKDGTDSDAVKKLNALLERSPTKNEAGVDIEKFPRANLGPLDDIEWRGPAPPPSQDEIIASLEEDLDLKAKSTERISPPIIETPLREMDMLSYYDLAIAYKEMELFAEAIDLLKIALRKKIVSPILRFKCLLLIAICYLDNHQTLEAIALLEKTLQQYSTKELHPEYRLAFLYHLAIAFEKSGQVDKALFHLRKIEKEVKKYRDIEERIKRLRYKLL